MTLAATVRAGSVIAPGDVGLRQGDARVISPGRDHFHHILFSGGFGVRQAPGILTGLQLFYALIAVAAHFAGVADVVMFTAWSVLFATQRTVIRQIGRYHRCFRLRRLRRLRLETAAGIG